MTTIPNKETTRVYSCTIVVSSSCVVSAISSSTGAWKKRVSWGVSGEWKWTLTKAFLRAVDATTQVQETTIFPEKLEFTKAKDDVNHRLARRSNGSSILCSLPPLPSLKLWSIGAYLHGYRSIAKKRNWGWRQSWHQNWAALATPKIRGVVCRMAVISFVASHHSSPYQQESIVDLIFYHKEVETKRYWGWRQLRGLCEARCDGSRKSEFSGSFRYGRFIIICNVFTTKLIHGRFNHSIRKDMEISKRDQMRCDASMKVVFVVFW